MGPSRGQSSESSLRLQVEEQPWGQEPDEELGGDQEGSDSPDRGGQLGWWAGNREQGVEGPPG